MKDRIFAAVAWFRDRLGERSTITGLSLAISGAAALPAPWCYYSLVLGTVGAFIPDGKVTK